MFDELDEWLRAHLPATPYTYLHGEFLEAPEDATKYFCVLVGNGGPRPDVEDRTKRYTVFFIGRKETRSDAATVLADAELIMQAMASEIMPCGASLTRAINEPVGPGFSNENRPFVQLDLEILF